MKNFLTLILIFVQIKFKGRDVGMQGCRMSKLFCCGRFLAIFSLLFTVVSCHLFEKEIIKNATICPPKDSSNPASAAEILVGKELWNSDNQLIIGTMANHGDWDLTTSFPGAGFFSSVNNAPNADEICSSSTVLGISGMADCSAGGCCQSGVCLVGTASNQAQSLHLLSGKQLWDSSGQLTTGTMESRGNWDLMDLFPGAGHYASVSNTPAADTICSTTTILGISGTADCSSSSCPSSVCLAGTTGNEAAAADVIGGKQLWMSNGQLLTGLMIDQGSWDLANTFPGPGRYSGVTNLPSANDICDTTQILGVAGAVDCIVGGCGGCPFNLNLHPSLAHRDAASSQITIATEKSSSGALPSNYREVPLIASDDEGYDPTSPVYPHKQDHNMLTCGTPASMIATPIGGADDPDIVDHRIAHCLGVNPTKATWNGASKGMGGETVWKLVSKMADGTSGKELWLDIATGFIWSDDLGSNMKWCRASGNSNASGVPVAFREDDPHDICDNATHQNQTSPYSACAEFTGAQSPLAGENYSTGTYHASKGGLGALSTLGVRWRLPTRSYWALADLHGARLVFKLWASTYYYWTATTKSDFRSQAWQFMASDGSWNNQGRDFGDSYQRVRCIGRIN